MGSKEADGKAFLITRIDVGDYDAWKPMFDQDAPGARAGSRGWRVLRNVDDPGEVFVQVEFASREDAEEGRRRLLASGVLDRFVDRSGPTVVEVVEAVNR
jgi:hypothetical protein